MAKISDTIINWEDQISSFPKLKFEDAKVLYESIVQENDEIVKQKKFNKLIEGTLYVVLNFVKRNKLSCLDNAKYDTDDIINTCCEIWINAIKDGELLNANSFANIIDTTFCTKMAKLLNETDLTVSDLTVISSDTFNIFLYEFIKLNKIRGHVTYEDFLDIFAVVYGYKEDEYRPYYGYRVNEFKLSDSNLLQQTYELLSNIVEAIEDEDYEIDFTRTKIDKFKSLLLEIGLQGFEIDIDNVYQGDYSDSLINLVDYSNFIKSVYSCNLLDDRDKDIITKHYGLNGNNGLILEDIASEYNFTRERARQIEAKALRYLRSNEEVRKYKSLL